MKQLHSTMTAQIKSSKAFFFICATSSPPRTEGERKGSTAICNSVRFDYITRCQFCRPSGRLSSVFSYRYKKDWNLSISVLYGGELGIWTLETLITPTRFPIVRLRPLSQLSILLSCLFVGVNRSEQYVLYRCFAVSSIVFSKFFKNFFRQILPETLYNNVYFKKYWFFVKKCWLCKKNVVY